MSQAPGWYDDPDDPNQLRYFDGILWTRHTAPKVLPPLPSRETSTQDPAQPRPAAPAPMPAPPSFPGAARSPSARLADGTPLAPLLTRLAARLLDVLIKGVVSIVAIFPWWDDLVRAYDQALTSLDPGGTNLTPVLEQLATEIAPIMVPVTLVQLAVNFLYETVFLVRYAATPGKLALGLRVRRTAGPGPIGWAAAARRQALAIIESLVGLVAVLSTLGSMLALLDPAWILFDPRRQALHDKIADTVVVSRG